LHIAIISHPQDRRLRTWLGGRIPVSHPRYQLDSILLSGQPHGLRWVFTDPDQRFKPADAAILHADMSLISQDYLDLAAAYPKAINGTVADIRKRHVSRNLVDRNSTWRGPVLVKSDLNCKGGPEAFLARQAARAAGRPPPAPAMPDYQHFDSLHAVPDPIWQDPARVVERYLPEKRGAHNVLRVWSFMGDYERCTWYSAPETIVKGHNIVEFGPSEIPDQIRAERARLGFDYGKFDFAIGPEGPVLYDANRTPAYLSSRPDLMREAGLAMSAALIRLIRGQAPLHRAKALATRAHDPDRS
jgi:hypothetical protein